jgi:hypothetical protein
MCDHQEAMRHTAMLYKLVLRLNWGYFDIEHIVKPLGDLASAPST